MKQTVSFEFELILWLLIISYHEPQKKTQQSLHKSRLQAGIFHEIHLAVISPFTRALQTALKVIPKDDSDRMGMDTLPKTNTKSP